MPKPSRSGGVLLTPDVGHCLSAAHDLCSRRQPELAADDNDDKAEFTRSRRSAADAYINLPKLIHRSGPKKAAVFTAGVDDESGRTDQYSQMPVNTTREIVARKHFQARVDQSLQTARSRSAARNDKPAPH